MRNNFEVFRICFVLQHKGRHLHGTMRRDIFRIHYDDDATSFAIFTIRFFSCCRSLAYIQDVKVLLFHRRQHFGFVFLFLRKQTKQWSTSHHREPNDAERKKNQWKCIITSTPHRHHREKLRCLHSRFDGARLSRLGLETFPFPSATQVVVLFFYPRIRDSGVIIDKTWLSLVQAPYLDKFTKSYHMIRFVEKLSSLRRQIEASLFNGVRQQAVFMLSRIICFCYLWRVSTQSTSYISCVECFTLLPLEFQRHSLRPFPLISKENIQKAPKAEACETSNGESLRAENLILLLGDWRKYKKLIKNLKLALAHNIENL